MNERVYTWIEPDNGYKPLENLNSSLVERIIINPDKIKKHIAEFEEPFPGKHPKWDKIVLRKSKLSEIKAWLGKDADQYSVFVIYLMALVQEQCNVFKNNIEVSQLRIAEWLKDLPKEAVNVIEMIEAVYAQPEKIDIFKSLSLKTSTGGNIKINSPLLIKDIVQAYVRNFGILKNEAELTDDWKEVVQDYFTGNSINVKRMPLQFTKTFCKLLSRFFVLEKILPTTTDGFYHIQGVTDFLSLSDFYISNLNPDSFNVRNWITR